MIAVVLNGIFKKVFNEEKEKEKKRQLGNNNDLLNAAPGILGCYFPLKRNPDL